MNWDDFVATYPLGKVIGQGSYGQVHLSGDHVVKVQSHPTQWDEILRAAVREMNYYSMLDHPCVMKLTAWTVRPSALGGVVMFSLPRGKSILQALVDRQITWKGFMEDVLSAVSFLHAHGIAHCDLKEDNVVF